MPPWTAGWQAAMQSRPLPQAPAAAAPVARTRSSRSSSSSLMEDSQHVQAAQQRQWQWQQRRRLLVPVAAAAKQSERAAAVQKPRHFLRPSLLATGLTEPADVLQHALALFRKADLDGLRQYLPDSYAAALEAAAATAATSAPTSSSSSSAGSGSSGSSSSGSGSSSSRSTGVPLDLPREPWLQVAERGPLAPLAGVLDVGARRVLPGHLLRRSQVLSTLRPSPGAFQQRVQLTASSGETSVFEWHLALYPTTLPAKEGEQQQQDGSASDAAAAGSSSSSSSELEPAGASSSPDAPSTHSCRWVIESVRRDPSCDLPLPTTPHPKVAPEAIVRAQLAALQQGDVLGASLFSMRAGRVTTSRKTSLVSHHDALRAKLQEEPYCLLLQHAAVQLGAAVLPTQRDMLQEVAVLAADGASARFVWRVSLSTNGCWMTSGILSAQDAAAALLQAPH